MMSAGVTDECPICLEPVAAEDACDLPCSHCFHKKCIKQWELCSRTVGQDCELVFTCPVCRMQNQASGAQLRASQTQLCLIYFQEARSLVIWVTGFDLMLWMLCLTIGDVHALGHILCAALGHVGARALHLWMLRFYLASCVLSFAVGAAQLVTLLLRGATAGPVVIVVLSLMMQCLLIDRVLHICQAIPVYLEAVHRHVHNNGASGPVTSP